MFQHNNTLQIINQLFSEHCLSYYLTKLVKLLIFFGIFTQHNLSAATHNLSDQVVDGKTISDVSQNLYHEILFEKKYDTSDQWQELLIGIKDLMIKKRGVKPPKAFISYAWEDISTEEGRIANSRLQRYLEKLRDDLQTAGISVFLDIGDMHGNMKKRMEENLLASEVIITINTPRFRTRALASPQTNLGFEYQLTLRRAEEIPYGIFPLHYSGSFDEAFGKWGDEKELKELKNFLIRDCCTQENYQSTLIATQRPLGIIPAIYNLDCDNDIEYNNLVKSWRWSEFSSIMPLNQDFVGREGCLAGVATALQENNVQTLTGTGGIGKSDVAVAYAYRHRNEYDAVRLISAENDNIKLEFEKMADLFAIDNKGMSVQELTSSVYRKIESYKWLLIFDNAEDYQSIKDYLPKTTHDHQHILITSRSQHWQNRFIISRFNDMEVFSYARRILPDITNKESIRIGQAVEYLPLSLSQAMAYIKGAGIKVEAYLSLYKKKGLDFLKRAAASDVIRGYNDSVAQTIAISAEKLKAKSPEAARMLLICSYLDPDNIPLKLLKHKRLLQDRETIYAALVALKNYSLVEPSKTPDSIQISRLTQAVIRDEYEKHDNGLQTLSEIIESLISYSSWDKITNNSSTKAWLILPHMQSVLNLVDSKIDSSIGNKDIIISLKGRLLSHMAKINTDIGSYVDAKKLYDRALPILVKYYGPESEELAETLIGLSYLYEVQGSKALALKEAIEAYKIIRDKNPDKASSYFQRIEKLQVNNSKQLNRNSKSIWNKFIKPIFNKIELIIVG